MSVSLQVDALGILAKWETPQEAIMVKKVAERKGWQFLPGSDPDSPPSPSSDSTPIKERLHAHLIKSGIAVTNMLNLEDTASALKEAGLEVN